MRLKYAPLPKCKIYIFYPYKSGVHGAAATPLDSVSASVGLQ